MPQTLLITGGAGFIGSHLVDACMRRGFRVIVLDNLSGGSRDNIAPHIGSENFTFIHGNIGDAGVLKKIFEENIDTVFHLAAHISVRESIAHPEKDLVTNILGTNTVLEAMRYSTCRRIIFSSTGGALFSGGMPPYTESHTPRPTSPYGISKLTDEMLIEFYTRTYGFVSTILRYANVYGPGQSITGEAGVIGIFQRCIEQGTPPTIYGDGSQTRDFIHVDDVVTANIHVLEKHLSGVYHVGTGIETSVLELWNTLAQHNSSSLVPQLFSPNIGEVPRSALSPEKLMATGWRMKYSGLHISHDLA